LIPQPPDKIVGGEVIFDGVDLLKMKPIVRNCATFAGGKVGVIFQEPMTSLNPVLTGGEQIMENVRLHMNVTKEQACKRAIVLITMVGIPDAEHRVDYYPHQFSGGMRQRIMIAMAAGMPIL
jgi:ABC-type dipeptide/oligopeptide/nickel transport system ATPase component